MFATILSVWCPSNCSFQYVLKSAHSPASHLFTFPLTSTSISISILFISHYPYSIFNFQFSIFTSHSLLSHFLLPHSLTSVLPHSLLPHSLIPSFPYSLTSSYPHSLTPHSLTPHPPLPIPPFPTPILLYLSLLPSDSPTSHSTHVCSRSSSQTTNYSSQPNQLHKKTFPGPTSGRTLNYIS